MEPDKFLAILYPSQKEEKPLIIESEEIIETGDENQMD